MVKFTIAAPPPPPPPREVTLTMTEHELRFIRAAAGDADSGQVFPDGGTSFRNVYLPLCEAVERLDGSR